MKFARTMRPMPLFAGMALLLAGATVRADEAPAAGNPYMGIVERNVFALVPIPTNPPVDPTPPEPPIKVTVNGIMNVFGQLEVIFEAAIPAKGKEAAHDKSYEMAEGERQDDIEVVKIDDKTSIVTLINHGIKQELALANAPNITAAAPAPPAPGGGGGGGGVPMPRGAGGPFGGGNGLGERPDRRNGSNANSPNNAFGGLNGGGGGSASGSGTQAQLTPEEQVVLMEAQRAKWLDEGNKAAAIIPPTPLGQKLIGGSGENAAPPSPP